MLFTNLKQAVIGLVFMFIVGPVWANPYLYSSVCPNGPGGNPGGAIHGGHWASSGNFWADKWNFAQCNCTSYVTNRINMNGFAFQNQFRNQHWGNAHNWDNAATAAGMSVDASPAAGSVAQWNIDEIGGNSGHVAYVESVTKDSDGSIKSIRISEYNYQIINGYSERTLKPSESGYPPRFIHFDIRAQKSGSIGWFPSVSVCSQASQWFIIGTVDGERIPIGTASAANCPQACVPPN